MSSLGYCYFWAILFGGALDHRFWRFVGAGIDIEGIDHSCSHLTSGRTRISGGFILSFSICTWCCSCIVLFITTCSICGTLNDWFVSSFGRIHINFTHLTGSSRTARRRGTGNDLTVIGGISTIFHGGEFGHSGWCHLNQRSFGIGLGGIDIINTFCTLDGTSSSGITNQ